MPLRYEDFFLTNKVTSGVWPLGGKNVSKFRGKESNR